MKTDFYLHLTFLLCYNKGHINQRNEDYIMSKWDLTYFYENDEAWLQDLENFEPFIEKLASFQGKLSNFDDFKAFHQLEESAEKLIFRLYAYIHLASDLNLKDTDKSSKNQQLMILLSKLNQQTAYVSPEIIALGKELVFSFLDRDTFLNTYRFNFEKLFLQQKHVLSNLEERLLSNFGPVSSIGSQLYQALSIVDATDSEVTLSDGKKTSCDTFKLSFTYS